MNIPSELPRHTLETPKQLMVVGDPTEIEQLTDRLYVEGFEVIFHPDAESARMHIGSHGLPHLMLVDLNLPDMNGLEFCQELLSRADLPIIALSSEDPPGLAARALQHADDYVRRPFEPDELIMRIRRVLSRIDNFSYARGPKLKICEDLILDYARRVIIVEGEEQALTPTENALLHVLIKHWGNVVDADTLIERVWRTGSSINDRNSLRVHMHRLRHKIEDDPTDPSVILTERGVGYVFIGC